MRTARILAVLVGFFAFLALSLPVTYNGQLYDRSLSQRTNDKTLPHAVTLNDAAGSQLLSKAISLSERATKPSKSKPAKSSPAKKPSTPPKAGICTRASPAGCGTTESYDIVAAAAKKKGETLKLGESYLLQVKTGVHKQLVLAKVIETADKKLDVDAAMSQLVKFESDSNAFLGACKMLHGAECAHKPHLEYKCDKALGNGAKFKFVGAAKPEYADKRKFISDGEIPNIATCSQY